MIVGLAVTCRMYLTHFSKWQVSQFEGIGSYTDPIAGSPLFLW